MIFRPNPRPDGAEGAFLLARVRLFVIGGGLAIGGIVLDLDYLVWAAMIVLVVGVVLGLVSRRRQRRVEDDEVDDHGEYTEAVGDDERATIDPEDRPSR